ncbi:MAG: hypothetical protein WC651_05045 [Candidatus Gracilibacteria bacterium]
MSTYRQILHMKWNNDGSALHTTNTMLPSMTSHYNHVCASKKESELH